MRRFGAIGLGLAALAAPALATDEEIIALSAQSGEVFASGRFEDGARLAEAAWHQGEAEWGASEDTAFLALNYVAQLVAMGQRAPAREPAARVLELAEAGAAPSIPLAEARLTAALVNVDPAAPDETAIAMLQQALAEAEAAGMHSGQMMWNGWLDIARVEANDEDWSGAWAAGGRVMEMMDATGAGVPDLARTEAALIAGAAAMENEAFDDAALAYTWAASTVARTRQTPAATMTDPAWATLTVWAEAARSLYLSERDADEAELWAEPAFYATVEQQQDCTPRWLTRRNPDYPEQEIRLGRVGAVVLDMEFEPSGATRDVRVVAELPEDGWFGQVAADAAGKWSADPASLDACAGGVKHHVLVSFTIPARP